MAGVRIAYRDGFADWLARYDRSGRRTVLERPLGATPASEKPLEIRETARLAALFDIVEQMPSAAIAIFPARGEKRLEVQGDVDFNAAFCKKRGLRCDKTKTFLTSINPAGLLSALKSSPPPVIAPVEAHDSGALHFSRSGMGHRQAGIFQSGSLRHGRHHVRHRFAE